MRKSLRRKQEKQKKSIRATERERGAEKRKTYNYMFYFNVFFFLFFLFHSSCRFSFLLFYFCSLPLLRFWHYTAFSIKPKLNDESFLLLLSLAAPLLLPLLLLLSAWHYGEGFTPSVNAQRSKTSHEVCKVTPCE